MAPETSSSTTQVPSSALSRGSTAPQVWQLPMFVLGAAALVGVFYARPYIHGDLNSRYVRELANFRQTLESPNGIDQARPIAERIEQLADQFPAQIGEANLLLGTFQLMLAESKPDGEPASLDIWKTALDRFATAEKAGVPEADRFRLQYRQAKVWEQLDAVEPLKVIEALSKSVGVSEDPAEGYRRMAEAYLRLPTPDLRQARGSLREFISRTLPGTDPRKIARSRLTLGELHIRLNEYEDARKVLERVPPEIAPDLYLSAQVQLARSYLAEDDVATALKALEQAKQVKSTIAGQREGVLYYLGQCYLKSSKREQAMAAWDEARNGSGPEAQASALRLAELLLPAMNSEHSHVVGLIDLALKNVKVPSEYTNTLIPIKDARALVEEAITLYKQASDYDSALKLAKLYARVAENNRDREVYAEIATGYGDALTINATKNPAEKDRLLTLAQIQFRAGAEAFAAIAQQTKPTDLKIDLTRKSSQAFLKAGDQQKAIDLLNAIAQSNELPEGSRGDIWLVIGEARQSAGDKVGARESYRNALKSPGPATPRVRLQMARLDMAEGKAAAVAHAITTLELNLDPEWLKDKDTHSQSLFLLAEAHYLKHDWRKAETRLIEALTNYPDYAKAIEARHKLARCYWYQAASEAKAIEQGRQQLTTATPDQKAAVEQALGVHQKSYEGFLRKTVEAFDIVDTTLARNLTAGKLSPEEGVLMRNAAFAAAECFFFLGEYDESIRRYQALANRYKGQAEQLIALSQVWQLYTNLLKDTTNGQKALEQMRNAFVTMPEESFTGVTKNHNRKFWQDWFRQIDEIMPAGTR